MSTIMNFENFRNKLMEDLTHRFSSGDCQVKLKICTIPGNNGVHEEKIEVKIAGAPVSPCIPINQHYTDYTKSRDYMRICDEMEKTILDIVKTPEKSIIPIMDSVVNMKKSDYLKENVYFRLVNASLNEELLSKVPHRMIAGLDLAIVYRVMVRNTNDGVASYEVKNGEVEYSEEELYEMALNNTPAFFEEMFKPLLDVFGGVINKDDIDKDDNLYILSNKQDINGATAIVYPGCLERVSEEMERNHGSGDFYMLPCSVHEVLIISDKTAFSKMVMIDMIRDANTSVVSQKDILSYNLYHYKKNAGLEIVSL